MDARSPTMLLLALLSFLAVGVARPAVAREPPGGAGGWVEIFTDDGITAWEKELPGRDLPVYRANGVFKANMYELMAVLNDFSRHKEWMRFMRETSIKWRADDFNLIIYVLFDAPWPVWDRDTIMYVHVDLDRAKQELTMSFERFELDQLPPIEGIIRVPRGELWARLRYLGPNRTEVEGWMDIDPAGDLPHWLVRWFTRRIPHQALQRMREQLVKTKGLYAAEIRKYDPTKR